MTHQSAAAVLDEWASRAGKAPAPPAPAVAPTDALGRIAPEKLCIPGHDDAQEGDPDRNAMPLVESMVLSVMALGVLEPIIVRKRTDGALEVIAGRRRTRHAREANRRLLLVGEQPLTVPINIKGGRLSPEMAMLIDATLNEHRENDPPSVKVRKAAKFAAHNIDVVSIATAYRVEPRMVERWIAASKAAPFVATALDEGRITIQTAAMLSSQTPEVQYETIQKLVEIQPTQAVESAVVRAAVRPRTAPAPLPGAVPKRAVSWILAAPEHFSEDFLRGIRFVRGELTADEVREILAKVGR